MRIGTLFLLVLLGSINFLFGFQEQANSTKIKILNFGTFHMGITSDANKTEFDEHNKNNVKQAHAIAKMLSKFKPTVIVVENVPENNWKLQNLYDEYLKNPKIEFERPDEVELLAYESGRISKAKHIYGIDHKMEYNYRIAEEIVNVIDSLTVNKYYENPFVYNPNFKKAQDNIPLLERLQIINNDKYLDFLITVNADILAYAGTKDGFEGADEAAKYYQRNLRMYSNLNRIPLTKDDKVFILMGASYTAFFRDFINRSPKYEKVDTFTYLK